MFQKNRKWVLLICFITGIIIDVIYCFSYMSAFPKVVITGEDLLHDKEHAYIKEFEVNADGSITSQSGDAWISWTLEKPIKVEEMKVVLRSMDKEETWGQIYLLDTLDSMTYTLENGRNHIKFYDDWREKEVTGFRFDLTSEEELTMNVEEIVINGHTLLFWEIQLQALVIFLAVLALIFTYWAWDDYAKKKENDRYWIGGAAALGLQVGLYVNFVSRYIKENKQGQILIWYLIMIAVLVLLEQFVLRYYISRQDNQDTRQTKVKNSLALGLVFLLTALVNFAIIEILGGVQFDFSQLVSMIFNLMIYLIVILVVYLIIRRPGIALIVSNVLMVILGLVNHYYYQFRGEPFEFASVIMADTAFSVLDNYRFAINDNLWFVILAEILFLVITIGIICRSKINFPRKVKLGLVAPVVVMVLVIAFHMPAVNYWSIAGTSISEGYLYSFLGYLKELGTPDKPKGYTAQNAQNVLEAYTATEGQNTPDVIVIMNEAFADLPEIYDFETDTDTLPFIHSLTDNTVKGQVLVSVFGGTTCNSEYEFLTSNSMAFMPGGSVPYMQYIQEEQQSLAQLLKNRGYVTCGYHSFYKSGFHRNVVYPLLGFDEFYGLEDTLPGTEIFRMYMGDRANYHNVKYLYEKNISASPQFVFNVTMQNHGGYASINPSIDVTSQPADEDMQTPQLQEYLSLLYESDAAFKELVEYYENVERDTIILMFGDHQPGLGNESYEKMDARVLAEDATLEEKQKQYISSFVMWANFDIEEQEDVFLSANYLRPFLLKTAGMDLSSYDSFLLELREKIPAINAFGYCDTDGNWYEIDDIQNSMLQQYSWLHYYNVFDKKRLDSKYYTE